MADGTADGATAPPTVRRRWPDDLPRCRRIALVQPKYLGHSRTMKKSVNGMLSQKDQRTKVMPSESEEPNSTKVSTKLSTLGSRLGLALGLGLGL